MIKAHYVKRFARVFLFCLGVLLLPLNSLALTCPNSDLFYNTKYSVVGEHSGLYFLSLGTKNVSGVNWIFMATVDADNSSDATANLKKVLDNKKDYQLVQQDDFKPTVTDGTSYCIYIVKSTNLALTWTGLLITVSPVPKDAVSFVSGLPPVK